MTQLKHPPGPPMTLGNMRRQGVHHLIAYCLNDACPHTAPIDVSGYPDVIEVPSFGKWAKCEKCGASAWTCGLTGKRRRPETRYHWIRVLACESRTPSGNVRISSALRDAEQLGGRRHGVLLGISDDYTPVLQTVTDH